MTALDHLGGEDKLKALVETFYDLIETLLEGSNIRRLHGCGNGAAHARIRLKDAENWLVCMKRALDDEGHSGPHVQKLRFVFARVATVLINEVPDWEDDR